MRIVPKQANPRKSGKKSNQTVRESKTEVGGGTKSKKKNKEEGQGGEKGQSEEGTTDTGRFVREEEFLKGDFNSN